MILFWDLNFFFFKYKTSTIWANEFVKLKSYPYSQRACAKSKKGKCK